MKRSLRTLGWTPFAWLLPLCSCHPNDGVPTTPSPAQTSLTEANATLSNWTADGRALEPGFDPLRQWYAADAEDMIELVATPTHPEATVEQILRTMDGLEVDRVGASGEVAFTGGYQVIAEVTAADGQTRQEYVLTALPSDFPELDVWSSEPGLGWYFLCNMDFAELAPGEASYLMIIDASGIPRWIRRVEGITFDLRAAPGDRISWVDDSEGGSVRSNTGDITAWLGSGDTVDPHEFQLLENGNALMIAGRVSEQDLREWGGPANMVVIDQAAQEVGPDGSVVFEWTTAGEIDFDHVPEVWKDWSQPAIESAHLNSIEIDPHDDNWIVSLRIPSQVRKIDRNTKETLWTLGGPGSDFTLAGDERLWDWVGFSWQHTARVTGPDRILLFDNALAPEFGSTGPSRMVEYQLDLDAMTATVVNSWELPGSGFTYAAGSAQRLADGHTLLGFGNLGYTPSGLAADVVELNEYNDTVLEIRLPAGQWSYRVWKFDRDEDGWILP
jgi:hypothetical protein